jgi:hypothetical protein
MFTWDCMAMLEHYETVSGAGEVHDLYTGQYGLSTSGPHTIYFPVNICSVTLIYGEDTNSEQDCLGNSVWEKARFLLSSYFVSFRVFLLFV